MSLPRIHANYDLADVTGQAWNAIEARNQPPFLFRYGDVFVRLEHDEEGTCSLQQLTQDRLRYELARAVEWYRPVKTGWQRATPPIYVIRDMLATPNPPLPVLERITEVPVFAADGTLQTEPGYQDVSKIYLTSSNGSTLSAVPEAPKLGQIRWAKGLIFSNLLVDFPFVAKADRAHALALFLLPFARDLIDGSTPNHLIESPTPGTGKDLLTEACLRPALGRNLGFMAQANNDEEWRKRITASLKEGKGAILIGNITRPLASGVLAAALTALTWSDRVLGKNDMFHLPVRCVWATTGNNPTVSTEIARRSIRIRLDAGVERPWERKHFKHPDLLRWVDEHRGGLVRAALILIQAWVAAGKPVWQERSLGSYEQWSAVMGGILQVVGVDGFLGNLHEFYEFADLQSACWQEFVHEWWKRFGGKEVRTSDLVSVAIDSAVLSEASTEHGTRVSLGAQLGQRRDQVIDGYRLVQEGTAKRAALWRLVGGESSESR